MAEILNIGGQEFKKRSPLASWGLVFLTIFIYYFVWYYKINKEAKNYLGDENIRPGIALLAVSLGSILIIPHYVSIYRTGERVQRMQQKAGVQQQLSPALGVVASIFLSLHVPYIQENLNRIWTLYQRPATGGAPAPGVLPPGTVPPGGGFTG